jgi:hypothetical protein
MTIDQLDLLDFGEQGSSCSSSRLSKRRKGSCPRSKGSFGSKGSFSDSSTSLGKTKARRSRTTVRSCEKVKENDGVTKSSSSKTQRKPSGCNGKVNQGPKYPDNAEPLVTGTLGGEGYSTSKKNTRAESPGTLNRKKSYLNKRKAVKADKAESQQAKRAVDVSLDTLLKRIGQASQAVKDDNRSVYSSMQEKDRQRRERENYREEIYSSRVDMTEPRRSLESALGGLGGGGKSYHDTDSKSVASAPLLRSKSRSTFVKRVQEEETQLESQRPIVDLKKTQFSNKLTKLHVAF